MGVLGDGSILEENMPVGGGVGEDERNDSVKPFFESKGARSLGGYLSEWSRKRDWRRSISL